MGYLKTMETISHELSQDNGANQLWAISRQWQQPAMGYPKTMETTNHGLSQDNEASQSWAISKQRRQPVMSYPKTMNPTKTMEPIGHGLRPLKP